jgi:predicted small secreted protein
VIIVGKITGIKMNKFLFMAFLVITAFTIGGCDVYRNIGRDVGEVDEIPYLTNQDRIIYFVKDGKIFQKIRQYHDGVTVRKEDSDGDGWFDIKYVSGRNSDGGWGMCDGIHERVPEVPR